MPIKAAGDRHIRLAVLILLWLELFAGICATTLIHWLSPVHRTIHPIVPLACSAIFGSLIIALLRRPGWLHGIVRLALAVSALALIVPAWFYTLQALSTPGVLLIDVLPPVSSMFVMLLMLLMIFISGRVAFLLALLCWLLIALPVLVYLVLHPREMWTPHGLGLLMTYGPVSIMVVVLLPVQRGLADTIRRMTYERARVEDMLHRDPLTGIHNRRLGERVLRNLLKGDRVAGVVMVDMDGFKAINDTYGHPAGDRVLRAVAERFKVLLRADECIARWGGEEFLLIVPDIDAAGLQMVAERLQMAIARLPVAPLRQVTASFGATMIDAADTFDTVLQRADHALYAAKEWGGNRVVFLPTSSAAPDGLAPC